ncbi:MAG: twin-arginine translocation signal domain-containing protein, partial [Betaproteobacteria bacterium]
MKIDKFTTQAVVTNVSRRNLLKGIAATGGLVLAAQFIPRMAIAAYKTGAEGMPGGVVWDPHVYVSIDPSGT